MFPQCISVGAQGGRWSKTSDVIWSRGGTLPVIGVDLVAHGDVSHVLRELEWSNLIFGVRLRVNGIGRTEQNCSYSQAAGKQLFSEIQLKLHVIAGKVADVRMGKSVIPNFVALTVNT